MTRSLVTSPGAAGYGAWLPRRWKGCGVLRGRRVLPGGRAWSYVLLLSFLNIL